MSVWRTCLQQGRPAVDFLSQLLRGPPVPLAAPVTHQTLGRAFETRCYHHLPADMIIGLGVTGLVQYREGTGAGNGYAASRNSGKTH
jgi:hypothetical protein